MASFEYYMRFKTEEIFLWNDEFECYIRSTPAEGYFIKFPGGYESKVAPESNTVLLAIEGQREVTREEYKKGSSPEPERFNKIEG